MASVISNAGAGLTITPKSTPRLQSTPKTAAKKQDNSHWNVTLQRVIGTTTTNCNAFDCVESSGSFAYTAGATAVLCTRDGDSKQVSQKFFGAAAQVSAHAPATPGHLSPRVLHASPGSRPGATPRTRASNVNSYFLSQEKDGQDSPSGRRGLQRERAKPFTCVSLSADGELLAVGETGHKPRVMVFSTASSAPMNRPLITLAQHTFGVRCLAFSPDSQYLASMGELHDGYIHIWKINARKGVAKLRASNKSTSNVRQIAWIGNRLITIGTRHVKVWRVQEGSEDEITRSSNEAASVLTLAGRNCILGSLMDQTFVAVVALAENKAVVCSEHGDICILDDSDTTPSFTKVAQAGFNVTAMAVLSSNWLIVGGITGDGLLLEFDSLVNHPVITAQDLLISGTTVSLTRECAEVSALGASGHDLIVLDSLSNMKSLRIEELEHAYSPSANARSVMEGHSARVLGVQSSTLPNPLGAAFFTWSVDGSVIFWDSDGALLYKFDVEMERKTSAQPLSELMTVQAFRNLQHVVSGDSSGIVKIHNISDPSAVIRVRAHASEITDLAIYEDDDAVYIATAGRDRVIQLFLYREAKIELMQTLAEHVGSIVQIAFNAGGTTLVTCSTDRSVIIWGAVALTETTRVPSFVKLKSLALKSAPVSMSISSATDFHMFLSTTDRHVLKYDLRNGELLSSFKAFDTDGSDLSGLSSIVHYAANEQSGQHLAGTCNSDKTVRIYTEMGQLLSCGSGHADGITGLAATGHDGQGGARNLITTASDGTVFMWKVFEDNVKCSPRSRTSNGVFFRNSGAVTEGETPLRKFLSASETARLQEVWAANIQADTTSSPTKGGVSETPARPRRPSKLSYSSTPIKDCRSPRQSQHLSPSIRADSRAQSRTAKQQGEEDSMAIATDQVCRSLQAYRKKLERNRTPILSHSMEDLERELSATVAALARNGRMVRTTKPIDTTDPATILANGVQILDLGTGKIEQSENSDIGHEAKGCSEGTTGAGHISSSL